MMTTISAHGGTIRTVSQITATERHGHRLTATVLTDDHRHRGEVNAPVTPASPDANRIRRLVRRRLGADVYQDSFCRSSSIG